MKAKPWEEGKAKTVKRSLNFLTFLGVKNVGELYTVSSLYNHILLSDKSDGISSRM